MLNTLHRIGAGPELPKELTQTTELLQRCRNGEPEAREILIQRYLPRLKAWAHGRLPRHGRDLAETEDLVQVTFLRTLKRLDDFESRRPGAFLAYLRTVLLNLVREELRRNRKRPMMASLGASIPADQASQVEVAVGLEKLQDYERALNKLPDRKRAAVIMRVEFQMEFAEIAAELECPSTNAARMLVTRALGQLADELKAA